MSHICFAQTDTLQASKVKVKYRNNTFTAKYISSDSTYTGYFKKSELELHYYEIGYLKTVYLFNKNNKNIKRFLSYNTSGDLIEEGKYHNAFKIGDWKYYNKVTGQLICIGSFYKNKKNRKWKYYDENKKLIRIETYRDDKLLETYCIK